MNIDRYFLLRRSFEFSGGDPGRCYSLPVNPEFSATEPACCCAPTYTNDPNDRTRNHTSVPSTRDPELSR